MALQAQRIQFRIDRDALEKAFAAFKKPENRSGLPKLDDRQVAVVIYLTQLFVDEFLSDDDYSLETWGWLQKWAREIGAQHDLDAIFEAGELLKLDLVPGALYLVLFNGVEVGCGHKLPDWDPVNQRHVPPDDVDSEEGVSEPVPGDLGGSPDDPEAIRRSVIDHR